MGTHEDLLTTSPTYQRLYQLQFIDQPEAEPEPEEPLTHYLPGFEPAYVTGKEE
jgi:hypothetical protein